MSAAVKVVRREQSMERGWLERCALSSCRVGLGVEGYLLTKQRMANSSCVTNGRNDHQGQEEEKLFTL